MIRLTSILLICGAPLVPALASAQGAAEAKKPARTVYQRLKPCKVEGIEREVLCGTLAAWENRTAKNGRKIEAGGD